MHQTTTSRPGTNLPFPESNFCRASDILEARAHTRFYHHTPAATQVSFTLQPGEILGYLGPNGAGGSTTVKMMTGLIEPPEGQIFYNGRTVYDDFTAFQKKIGYVPEEPHVKPSTLLKRSACRALGVVLARSTDGRRRIAVRSCRYQNSNGLR